MKKMIGFILMLLFVQGCSAYIPNEQVTMLPERLSAPSALVLMNDQATVVGVDGSLTKITKMGDGVVSNFSRMGSQTFFIISSSSLNSLWEWDKEKNTLACIIPKIQPKSLSNRWIESYEVSDDKKFCLFKYWLQQTQNEKLLYTFSLFSIKQQKEIMFPVSSEEIVSDAWYEQGESDRFYFITRSKKAKDIDSKKVYWWNTTTNESKLLATFEGEAYSASSFGRWLAVVEENMLIRYSLDTGVKDILKENLMEVRFIYVGQKPYLFLCEYGTNSIPVCSYMSPDKEWKFFSFHAFDDIESFEVADENHVIFFTQNQLTKMKSLYKWDSSVNKTSILHQSNSIKKDFLIITHSTTKGRFIDIRIQDEKKGGLIILHNLIEGTTKTFDKKADNAIPLSNDGTNWYFWSQKEQSAMMQIPYMYNFKEGKEYPIIESNLEDFVLDGATNDGKYVVISGYNKKRKSIVIEMPECKEVPLPDVGNFQFITWLE
ncbi:hypothetical protein LLG10_04475 [bacterium]|nr:hypothetical protein [bacterium]